MRSAVALALVAALTTGCTDAPSSAPSGAPSTPAHLTSGPAAIPAPSPSEPPAPPVGFDADRALRTVRHLASAIGPRLATGPAYDEAAAYVARAFRLQGYAVRRQSFPVPAGDSWGVPVAAGRSSNVVATPAGFDRTAPYVVLGAHLDTVAVSPGAEDNASGVAVLLELARVLHGEGQVQLVAFGGEEPRGPGDAHHFGSRRFVAALGQQARRSLRGMVALDRVGVGRRVPLSSMAGTPSVLRDRLARIARDREIPTVVGTDAASDHESFAAAGLLAARVGSTSYAGYHSAGDLPRYVERAQLRRVGRLLTGWLRAS